MTEKQITVRDTTTPDSADLRLTVSGAENGAEAEHHAAEWLAASRHFKGWEAYEVKRVGVREWDCWCERA